MKILRLHSLLIAAFTLAVGTPATALAHGERGHGKASAPAVKEQTAWGIAADAREATRTLEVVMSDDMRFAPERVRVEAGETLRLVVKNAGKVMHELVIGDAPSLAEHAAMMKKFPNMEHDEPYMAHVPPGETREIVWTFNRAGEFEFACLIPGHYEAGMKAAVAVGGASLAEGASGKAAAHGSGHGH
ncbi:MAG: cupredoxin family protein [Pseudazoarcus pumilus]|nr:cupredoxin family protein [Pseudazoarcus pumilus]